MTLTTCLLAILHASVAAAAPPTVRAVDGGVVSINNDTVVVLWRLDDIDSLRALASAQRAQKVLGVDVVMANLDGADTQSRLQPYLRAHGIKPTAVVRVGDGGWQALQDQPVGLVVLGHDGTIAARIQRDDDQNLTLLRVAAATDTVAALEGPALAQIER